MEKIMTQSKQTQKTGIPPGWRTVRLGEIIDLLGGGTPKTSIAEFWNGNLPWLSVADFNIGRKFVFKSEKSITEAGLQNSSTKLLNSGDIIISARGTVGIVAMLRMPMTFNQSCYGIRAKNKLTINNYVYYLLKNTVDIFCKNRMAEFLILSRKTLLMR